VRKIAVIGLGRFGMELARRLAASGVEVIAIDRNPNLVNEIKDDVDVAVRIDSTDETALRSQEIEKVDVCVISIGENFEAALLTTVLVKKLEIPEVICRAQTQFHADIFLQIGSDEVIQPEQQAGQHLARRLANPHLQDFITLAEGYTLVELDAPDGFVGKTLKQVSLRVKFGVNLVAIKRTILTGKDGEVAEQEKIISVPGPDTLIEENDILVLVGSDEALSRLSRE
jgi:trk system potassium uptake protein TrkA